MKEESSRSDQNDFVPVCYSVVITLLVSVGSVCWLSCRRCWLFHRPRPLWSLCSLRNSSPSSLMTSDVSRLYVIAECLLLTQMFMVFMNFLHQLEKLKLFEDRVLLFEMVQNVIFYAHSVLHRWQKSSQM